MNHETLPRCNRLDGTGLTVVPGNIEAGQFCEANCVTITDGERSAVYVPADSRQEEVDGLKRCLRGLAEQHAYSPYFENGQCRCDHHREAAKLLRETK